MIVVGRLRAVRMKVALICDSLICAGLAALMHLAERNLGLAKTIAQESDRKVLAR
jgi:hypothetical protein